MVSMATSIDRFRLQDMVAQGAQLVEVLAPGEYSEDHLPGARNLVLIPLSAELRSMGVLIIEHVLEAVMRLSARTAR